MDVEKYPVRVYDRDQISKGYRSLVFKPGAPSASSEMNEMQQIANYNMARLSATIHPDATVISGGFNEVVDNVVRMNPTTTTISGNFFEIPETEVKITGVGDEVIGFLYKEKYITSSDDPTLLNPAMGTANYGSPGADRIKVTVEWSLMPMEGGEDEKFFPIYTFVYGVLQTLSEATDDNQTKLLNMMATYNYSTNGNYVTTGMMVSYVGEDEENERHIFELSAGEAFVEGYQISNKYSQKFYIPWLNDQKEVRNEYFTFTTNKDYQVRWTPLASVEEINGIIEITEPVIRSAQNQDRINAGHSDNSVVKIIRVSDSPTGGATYTQGTDYNQATTPNQDYIDWTNSPHHPMQDATYYITYHASALVDPVISEDKTSVYVSGLVPDSVVNIDYHFYLKRIDRIVLNRDGSISVLSGVPKDTSPVSVYNNSGLSLALVLVSRGVEPEVSVNTNRVYQMSTIQRLADRVGTNEYNIAVLSLKDEIRSDFPMTNKLNMVVDPFMNDNGRDSGRVQNAQVTGNSLMSGFNTNFKMVCAKDPITLDYSEVLYQSNLMASKVRSINIYSTINPNALGVLKVSPSKISWVASEQIRQKQGYTSWRTGFNTGTVRNNTSGTASGVSGTASVANAVFGEDSGVNWRWLQQADYSAYSDTISASGLTLPLPADVKRIKINAAQFAAGEICDLYLDINSTFAGSSGGTNVGNNASLVTANNSIFAQVTANADGEVVDAEVDLPSFMTTGSRLITIIGRTTKARAQTTIVAEAHTIDATVTYWYSSDPLAQTYMTTDECFITSVDIFLEEYPTSYIDVLLAHTIVGYPNHEEAHNQKRKYRKELVQQQWNKFKFDLPSRVEGNTLESFIVATSDSAGKIRCSELGKFDPYQKVWITKQGYESGTLLESSDAKTWSPIHEEDITFRLYRAQFSSTKRVELGTVSVVDATDLILSTTSAIYPGTNIEYVMTLVDRNSDSTTSNVISATSGESYEIAKYSGKVKVEAVLTTTNPMISPVLFGDIGLTTMTRIWPSNYISRNFSVTDNGRSNIRVILDQYEPTGSSIKVQYRDGENFVDMARQGRATVVSGDVVRVEYGAEVDLRMTQVQIIMDTTNDTSRPEVANLRIFVEPLQQSDY